MGKRVNNIFIVQQGQIALTRIIRILFEAFKHKPSSDFKKQVIKYLAEYAKLNMSFNMYIMSIIPESYRKDKLDKQFEDIIKQLKGKKK